MLLTDAKLPSALKNDIGHSVYGRVALIYIPVIEDTRNEVDRYLPVGMIYTKFATGELFVVFEQALKGSCDALVGA